MSIQFKFPIEPYKIQQQYAQIVTASLENNTKLCLLQSPTGTGKSYSILVSLIAWLQLNKFKSVHNTKVLQDIKLKKIQQNEKFNQKDKIDISSKQENKILQKKQSRKVPSWLKSQKKNLEEQFIKSQKEKLQQRKRKIINSDINQNMTKFQKSKGNNQIQIKSKSTKTQELYNQLQLQYSSSQQLDDQIKNTKRKLNQQITSFKQQQDVYNLPRVIFASRTHTQLTQIVNSFKKINTQLICSSLASKKNLCINQSILNKNIQNQCRKLLQQSKCPFYYKSIKNGYKQYLNKDIQQAITLGNKYGMCPYYALRSIIDVCDFVFVPYASILSKNIRHKLGINLRNAIVVFDEGHNTIQQDLRGLSKQLKFYDLSNTLKKIDQYMQKYGNRMGIKGRKRVSCLVSLIKGVLRVLKNRFDKRPEKQTMTNNQYQKGQIIDFLLELDQKQIQIKKIKKFIQQSHFINRIYNINKKSMIDQQDQNMNVIMTFVQFFEQIILTSHLNQDQNMNNCRGNPSKIIVYKYNNNILAQVSIKLLCFQALNLKEVIQLSKMTLITGGTLFPLEEFKSLVNKNWNIVQHEFEHIIQRKNCNVYIVGELRKIKLIYNYENNSNKQRQNINIEGIIQMLKKVKQLTNQGIIIFFQSYKYLAQIKQKLNHKLHPSLYQKCLFDSSSKFQNQNIFKQYSNHILNKNQKILFTVMGGKLSQGINFTDSLARILLIFGLPYPNHSTPQIRQRMSYYDSAYKLNGTGIRGCDYYQNLCMKTVNQTIGRAIRHINDYADIYLIDERYNKKIDKLSKWLRKRVVKVDGIQKVGKTNIL